MKAHEKFSQQERVNVDDLVNLGSAAADISVNTVNPAVSWVENILSYMLFMMFNHFLTKFFAMKDKCSSSFADDPP